MSTLGTPSISIIIPVYNVEPYLEDCLDSVLAQTFDCIEVICINDCSKDSSLNILQNYKTKDSRIKLINKPVNEGLAATRNLGLSVARGKYIMFLDSDDFIDPNLCKKAHDCAEEYEADIVIYDYAPFYNKIDLQKNLRKESALKKVNSEDKVSLVGIHAFAWTKLIRNEIIQTHGIIFPNGMTYEDQPFHWSLIVKAKNIKILPEKLCFYRQRGTSISYKTDLTLIDRILVLDLIKDSLNADNVYNTYKAAHIKYQLEAFYWVHEHINNAFKDEALRMIRSRLLREHWICVNQENLLPWQTKDFYLTLNGSITARIRRALWCTTRFFYKSIMSTLRRFS